MLRRGPPPDKHLPCDYRLGRRQYETLELYDGWLRGDKLQVDESTYEDAVDTGEEIDDRCQAARVTRLLNTVLPKFFIIISDAECFDARRPAAMQHATFARHGWATAPPKPGELMRRMVQRAEAAYRGARGLRPSYDVDDYNPDVDLGDADGDDYHDGDDDDAADEIGAAHAAASGWP